MRHPWIAAAAGTALLCLTPLAAAAAAAPRAVPATVRTVVRPVTAHHHAAPGYRITTITDSGSVDCSSPTPSPAAVDDGINECSPSADYPAACWRAGRSHHVLCLDDGRSHTLHRFRTSGAIAHARAVSDRSPLDVKLADGTYCSLRIGGTGEFLRQHRTWDDTYYCTHHRAVWAPGSARHSGVRHGSPAWTVEVAADSGRQRVHRVRVVRAWFVGARG